MSSPPVPPKPLPGAASSRSLLLGLLFPNRGTPAAAEAPPVQAVDAPKDGRAAPTRPASMAVDATIILDAVPDPIILIDKRRIVLSANAAAVDLLGESLVDRDLCLTLRHPQVLDMLTAVLQGEKARQEEILIPVPTPRTFGIQAKKLEISGPNAPSAVVSLQDLTLIKRTQAMRSEFVANVSHELRSPLSVLIGFFETLRGPAQDDTKARLRFLEIMEKEALRMSRLIDDLLSLSKIEAKENIRPDRDLSVFSILSEVVSALSLRAKEASARLELICADDLPPVRGDKDELVQVFHNLIVNAIKYGRPNQTVTIRAVAVERIADKGRPGIAISVIDQGEGIEAEHIPRLTERFYRVDKGRSRELGGTGLGLAIVKHIVNRHSGRMTVTSEHGVGSEFTVYLPSPGHHK